MEYIGDHKKNIYFVVKATCKSISRDNLVYKVHNQSLCNAI